MMIILQHSFSLSLGAVPRGAKELRMLWISPGIFLMGSPKDEPGYDPEDGPQFEVTISTGLWIGQFPVTQAQWQAVTGDNPSHFKQLNQDCPVENVSWNQAITFCQQLNKAFANDLPEGYRFSLPTEAQWEYACRAGTQTRYHSGNSLDDLSRVAWHKDNGSGHTHAVGEKEPNAWDLYDMHGNVMEWCFDSPSNYPNFPVTDWVASGNGRVRNIRGGSWGTPPNSAAFRSACRGYVEPEAAHAWFGFRLCLSKPNATFPRP